MPYQEYEKQKEYQRNWARGRGAARRAEWLKKQGPCVRCKTWDNLEVDHIDDSTKVAHSVWTWSEERRQAELAKCQVLCKKCHSIKTIEYLERPTMQHGNERMYRHRRCRCDLCCGWRQRETAKARKRAAR